MLGIHYKKGQCCHYRTRKNNVQNTTQVDELEKQNKSAAYESDKGEADKW